MCSSTCPAAPKPRATVESRSTNWTFLSRHSHVLMCMADNPDLRLHEIARLVGMTERSVQSIVADLAAAGAITRTRDGRCNHYEVHGDVAMQHPVESRCRVGDLLEMIARVAARANHQA